MTMPNYLQRREFLFRFNAFLPQLHDVDAADKHRIEELGEIALLLARVDTKV